MKQKSFENPVVIRSPNHWSKPIILSSPHSGDQYPSEFVKQSPLDLTSLRQSEDFKVDELFGSAPDLGIPLLKANFPRAYCDPNRESYELDPTMFDAPLPDYVATISSRISAGIGTIPKLVSAGNFIHRGPISFAEAERRITDCYFPYHTALRELIDRAVNRFNQVLVLDCHSMPSTSSPAPLADFVLGDRYGRSCPPVMTRFIAEKLMTKGYSVAFNTPYAGGYITRKYYQPGRNIHTLQIEISRHLYMDENNIRPVRNMAVLTEQLTELLTEISGHDLLQNPAPDGSGQHIQAAE